MNENLNLNENVTFKNALKIGISCVMTYMVYYYLKNVLSAFTPQMIETGLFDEKGISLFTSVYFICYAGGQLINGTLGDHVRPRYMVLFGLSMAGLSMISFSLFDIYAVRVVCFAFMGYGVSTLRGPLVKVFSENTRPGQARTISVFLSAIFILGPFIAGLFSKWIEWKTAFMISGIIGISAALLSFTAFLVLEKKEIIKYTAHTDGSKKIKIDVAGIFRIKGFIPYFLIGMIGEISATAIAFWITTYVTAHLGFSSEDAGLLSAVMQGVRVFSPFLCLALYGLFKGRSDRMLRIIFIFAASFYIGMFFIENRWINMIMFALAIAATGVSSSTVWSIYIPSLASSGEVSSANGVMDCGGYIAASGASFLFATIIESTSLSWKAVILTWFGLMVAGIALTFFAQKRAEVAPEKQDEN